MFASSNWWNIHVVAALQHHDVTAPLVRLVPTMRKLIAPLIHTDALTIVAGKLIFFASTHLQLSGVRVAVNVLIAALVPTNSPVMLSQCERCMGGL